MSSGHIIQPGHVTAASAGKRFVLAFSSSRRRDRFASEASILQYLELHL